MEAYVPKPENENPRRHADQLFDAYEVNTVPLSCITTLYLWWQQRQVFY